MLLIGACALISIYLLSGATALNCYNCPTGGENCDHVNDNQVRNCRLDQTVCVTTAVTLPSSTVATITRTCGNQADYTSQFPSLMPQQRAEHCHLFKESSGRNSRTCICNYEKCNSRDPQQIAGINISTAGASRISPFVSVITTVMIALVIKM